MFTCLVGRGGFVLFNRPSKIMRGRCLRGPQLLSSSKSICVKNMGNLLRVGQRLPSSPTLLPALRLTSVLINKRHICSQVSGSRRLDIGRGDGPVVVGVVAHSGSVFHGPVCECAVAKLGKRGVCSCLPRVGLDDLPANDCRVGTTYDAHGNS